VIRALYVPGHSVVHRLGAGLKLSLLTLLAVAVVAIEGWGIILVAALMVAAAWRAAGLGLAPLVQTLRTAGLVLLAIALAQAILMSSATAMLIVARIVLLMVAAMLVSATTSVMTMMETLERCLVPLRPLGVNPQYVAFMLVLTLRFVPALVKIGTDVRAAQKARGLERSIGAAIVPMLVRTFREADAVAEALAARGWPPR
jgi:biotin transport system permease protein